MKRFLPPLLLILTLNFQFSTSRTLTLNQIYESIPDTIMPRLNGCQPIATLTSDSLMRFSVNNVRYELSTYSADKAVLLVTLPLPEPDTQAYLYNIVTDSVNPSKLVWQEEQHRDFSDNRFIFCEATLTSVSPLTVQITQREPFAPSDEKKDSLVLKNIKLF